MAQNFLQKCQEVFHCCIIPTPDSSKHQCKNFVETLSNKLETVQNENKETIITRDSNCDYANSESHRDVKSCLSMNGFKQLIKKPTRILKTHQL